ncbi:MAG: glycosyltransferase family 4 protein [Anaerolineae bacterium]|nr:glycosyltransferase family 4 protein [Anaerolineae bacterium]
MRVVYHHDLLSATPNGIISYIRTFLKHSRLEDLQYWSTAASDLTVLLGRNEVILRNIPKVQITKIPSRFVTMASMARCAPRIGEGGAPIITNVNEHQVAISVFAKSCPTIFVSHGSNHISAIKAMGTRNYILVRFFDYLAVSSACLVILVSAQAHSVFTQRFPFHAAKMVYLPTFVDDRLFERIDKGLARDILKQEFGIDSGTFVVSYAGRLSQEKRVDLGLTAFAEFLRLVPDSFFLILGSGPLEHSLKDLAMQLGIGRKVRFVGDCEHSRTVQFLAASNASILCLNSGTSLFVLESLAAGTPVVARDIADHRRILSDRNCGYVLPASATAVEIALKLAELRLNQEQLSQNATEVGRSFMASAIVPRLDKLISTVI